MFPEHISPGKFEASVVFERTGESKISLAYEIPDTKSDFLGIMQRARHFFRRQANWDAD